MKELVTCVARDRGHADAIVSKLLEVGFWDRDITVHFPHRRDATESPDAQRSRATMGTILGGMIGATIGGCVALLASLGYVVVPGLTLFLTAGPLLAALSGAAAGAGFGAPTGGLIGLAILRNFAQREAQRSRPTVSVRVGNEDELAQAEGVFEQFGTVGHEPWNGARVSHAH